LRKLVFIFVFLLCAGYSHAQSYVGYATGTITIDSMYVVTAGSGTTFSFGSVNDYANSIEKLNYASMSIKCNYNWKLSVRATSSFFSASGGGSTNMPCSILQVRKSSGTYIPVSTTSQQLAVGNRGNSTVAGNSFNIDVDCNPGFSYNGGVYSIVLQYTITRQ
jgi:hypothetical protein